MYADDTCIIAPSPSALQKLLDICSAFAVNNSVLFNEEKTKCMCMKPRSMKKLHVPHIFLNNACLKFTESCKYLGINVHRDLSDDSDVIRHVRCIYGRGNKLVNTFRNCTDDVKNCLFKSFISSSYGASLWCCFKKSNFKKAVVAYNDVYRNLFGIKRGISMSKVYVERNIDCFKVIFRKTMYSFQVRIRNSFNTLLKAIVSATFFNHSKLVTKWRQVLNL